MVFTVWSQEFLNIAGDNWMARSRQIVSSIQTIILLNTLINSFIAIIYPPLPVESHHHGH